WRALRGLRDGPALLSSRHSMVRGAALRLLWGATCSPAARSFGRGWPRWRALWSAAPRPIFFFSSRRRHTRSKRDWSSDVCSSDLTLGPALLFCPADRPDRFGKAAERADGVVLDLEDAVANKDSARQALVAHPLDPESTLVRVNSVDSGELEEDLSAVREAGYDTVMLSKMTGPEDVQHLDDMRVVALCETARGVLAAPEIAAEEAVVGLMWGAEGLMGSLGGTPSRCWGRAGGAA